MVVTDRAVRDQLSRLNAEILGRDGDPFYGAPVVMVVLADRAQPTYLYDGSLVMGNLLNAAHALGWGACWIHRAREIFERPEGKALLAQWGIDADVEGIGLCVVGHAEHFPSHTPPRTHTGAMETHLRPGQKRRGTIGRNLPPFSQFPPPFFVAPRARMRART